MSTILAYPEPDALLATDVVLGAASGQTVAIPLSVVASLMVSLIANDQALIAKLAGLILSGRVPFNLPDEAGAETVPEAGSGLPYLSGGVLKIA